MSEAYLQHISSLLPQAYEYYQCIYQNVSTLKWQLRESMKYNDPYRTFPLVERIMECDKHLNFLYQQVFYSLNYENYQRGSESCFWILNQDLFVL